MDEENVKEEGIPRFTVVVAAYHSLAYLGECLASLAALDYPDANYRVIVLDLGCLDGIAQFAKAIPDYEISVRFLRLPNQPPSPSGVMKEIYLNRLRNEAVALFPSEIYVFTEDDCTYEPDWLHKLETGLNPGVGAAGGPDLLPEGMDWFSTTLDCILNAPLGRVGAKPVKGKTTEWYYPHKECIAIPSGVLEQVGKFPEQTHFSAEMEMARRIRSAGLTLVYLADNPVWHKRRTTLPHLLLRNMAMCKEKVHLLRRKGEFYRSFHFLVLLAAGVLALTGFTTLFSPTGRFVFFVLTALYASFLIYISALSVERTGKKSIGLGVFLLAPVHQLSNLFGILKGVLTKPHA